MSDLGAREESPREVEAAEIAAQAPEASEELRSRLRLIFRSAPECSESADAA